jgi:hypothetical protein
MNVEIGAEAALFPEKEYLNGIFVAVYAKLFTAALFIGLPYYLGKIQPAPSL